MFGSVSGASNSSNSNSNSNSNNVEVEAEVEEVELEAVLSEDTHLKHMRLAALEMAMSLVINRESSEDAVAITQMADVFFSWLDRDDADLGS